MLNLAEYRRRPALLSDWLPWAGLVAPGVVLNKDGAFQRTARFRGPDLDSATQGELIATVRGAPPIRMVSVKERCSGTSKPGTEPATMLLLMSSPPRQRTRRTTERSLMPRMQ